MSINEATRFDWDRATAKTGLEPWMRAAEEENSELWEDESLEEVIARQDEEEAAEDVVNNPDHYNTGNIECIDAIEESMSSVAFKGYLKGNCLKYLWRYDYKGKQVEDLQKAGWYLNKLTEMVTEENN
jgi:hypothetical protein